MGSRSSLPVIAMHEGAALAATLSAFALFRAAATERFPVPLRRPPALLGPGLRLVALALLFLAVEQYAQVEPLGAAVMVVLALGCASAIAFSVVVALSPRLGWSVALACLPASLLLALFGGAR